MSRYEVPGGHDSQFEPGSNRTVLRNMLGITNAEQIEIEETRALASSMATSYRTLQDDQPFTVPLIRNLHRDWLGRIYEFAGEYRSVDLSKENTRFCHAAYIPEQMDLFEENCLRTLTPCCGLDLKHLCDNVAKVHAELILIHPFREGNGRQARWISNLMVAQAGFPTITYDTLGTQMNIRESYFSALRKAFGQDTSDLSQLFEEWVLSSSEDRE